MQTGEPILGQIERGGVGGWVSITKAPPTDERGDIVGLVGINRIVTDVARVGGLSPYHFLRGNYSAGPVRTCMKGLPTRAS